MFTRTILATAACILIGAPYALEAQGRASMRFRGMDRNGDGVITRDEWRGNLRSFRNQDWNGDGVLSGDELDPSARRPAQENEPEPYQRGTFSDWTAGRFADLDHNRDGRLSRDEWHFDMASFRRADRNSDGWITRDEFLGLDRDDRGDRFDDLDYNRDGRVTRDEWRAGARVFNLLDRNRDGVLSRSELSNPGDERSVDLFTSLDVNQDRRITPDEWHWSRASFDSRDTNGDGVLSRRELNPAVATSGQTETAAYRAGYNRGLADGRSAGREDKANGHGWDLEGQTELEHANAGYASTLGPLNKYQAGYRAGFRVGYHEGYGPR